MKYVSEGLFALAYVFTVIDGTRADKGNYLSSPGRTGCWRYFREHPWIVLGAVCGVLGAVAGLL
jgi:hypothetical protein